jgi:predicted ATPase
MIHKVRIQNFKCLRDVSIDLEPFTVFVGANGSGKTSVLEAIHNAVRSATGDPQSVFAHERHGDGVYTRGAQGDLSISCETEGGAFRIEASPPHGYPPRADSLQAEGWEYRVLPTGQDLAAPLEPARKVVFLHLNAAVMARPSYVAEYPPRVEYTGEGLASVLAFMALNDPRGFDELVAMARTLIPGLQRIRFRKAKVFKTERELVKFGTDTVLRRTKRPYQGEQILFDFDHGDDVPAQAASEGSVLMLGLVTVLLGPSRPRILLLDDIEQALHPLAQQRVVAVMAQALQRFPDLQVLGTSHSPYLLDSVSPDQVRILATGPDGAARCGRLTDHPKFSTWKDEMSPGEIWSLFGEKWLTEGARPTCVDFTVVEKGAAS